MMRLKELRISKKIYQKDIADYLGVDRTTYSKYETGDSDPSSEMLSKLADFFDVSTDYLLGRDEKKPAQEGEHVPGYIDLIPEDRKKVHEYVALLLAARQKD